MSKSIEPMTGCKCLNHVAKNSIIKGLSFLHNDAIQDIKKIQKGPVDLVEFRKMTGLLNYVNILDRIKKSVHNTQECTKIIPSKDSIGNCSCLNPITRKFVLGSIDEVKNREFKEDIKEKMALIKYDVVHMPECK